MVRDLCERERVEVVHAMSAAGNLATLMAPRAAGRLFVSSPMGLQNSDRELALTTHARNLAMLAGADHVLVISQEIRKALERLPVHASLIDQDVVGVDIARFSSAVLHGRGPLRESLGIRPEDPLITTIGALHRRKSHDLFIAAAARLAARFPTAHFAIVGEGPERGALSASIGRAGLERRIHLIGARRDVPAILHDTDIYVKPGIVEGFIGITVLEAMAARRPVVAFDTVDVRAAVIHGQTGLLAINGDETALADAVARLLTMPDEAGRIADAGHAHVRARFALAAVASSLAGRYHQLLRQKAH